ncbi:MAG: cupin domain-containing protein [Polyangiales bacterium]
MFEGVDDGFGELAFLAAHGDDAASARVETEAHASMCPRCRSAHETLRYALSASLESAAPSESTRARLLALVAGPDRYAPFADRVASLFELESAPAVALLTELATSTERWRAGPIEGTAWWPVKSPVNARGVQTWLLRIEGGCRLPTHRHVGEETVLVIEGAYQSSDESWAAAGDVTRLPANSIHDLRVPPGAPCVCAVRLEKGMELLISSSSRADGTP